jgi:hypothetical protein
MSIHHIREGRKTDSLIDRMNDQLQQSIEREPSHVNDITFLADHLDLVNDWECDFVSGLVGYARLSDRQQTKLDLILRKVRLILDKPRLQQERRRVIR